MRKKDIKLFNKTIHEVKKVLAEISDERQEYHEASIRKDRERIARRRKHNKAVKKQIKELLGVVDELYELFDDLSTNVNGDKK